ncbi:MAG: hypothetical protein IPL61_26185 [Myxococcales bacterium]|nr:hypothetical protein [Myxococcales bacterium]
MRGALAVGPLVAACGGGSAPTTIGNRAPTAAPPGAAWVCPAGADLEVDLDGDGRVDRVRLAPAADTVACLEIHATAAPTLVCRAMPPTTIDQVELIDGHAEAVGVAACDPMGVPVRLVTAADPARGPIRRRPLELLGDAAPAGVALWLAGPDATAAIAWRDRWVWIDLGY